MVMTLINVTTRGLDQALSPNLGHGAAKGAACLREVLRGHVASDSDVRGSQLSADTFAMQRRTL